MIFCHISCFEIRSEDSFEGTQLSLLKQLSRWPIFLHSFLKFPSVERGVQKERFGPVEIVLDSPRVFTLHVQPLSAFLRDKCLSSLLVRFSSQVVQSVHISIYSASQGVNRDVSAQGCRVGASMPDFSLMLLTLSCGHSSDQGAAGGSLVWAKLQQPLTRGAALKSCGEEQNLSQLLCRLVQTAWWVHHHFLQNRCGILRFR